VRNKSDTFTVEGVDADLRHYIPTLAGRSNVPDFGFSANMQLSTPAPKKLLTNINHIA
jgi:hypothetical protein